MYRRVIHVIIHAHALEKIQAPSHASPSGAAIRAANAPKTRMRTHTYLDWGRSASQRTREVIIVVDAVDMRADRSVSRTDASQRVAGLRAL